jgi:protein-L-isoaspartate(D-aspartate) O-methyltransferase
MAGDPARLQTALVDHLLANGTLTRPEVAAAFRAVPRHLFLPELPIDEVYRDEAIPTKMEAGRAISSSSQPAIMAIMLEQLNVSPGQRVLEIGAGTGYNAALLGWLVGPSGRVVALDIDDDIVAAAQEHLAAASITNVDVICSDGGNGYAPGAPFDRIVLTVAAWDIAPAWYEQLCPGGWLVLPLRVANGAQKSIAFLKAPAGIEPRLISHSARDCGFMLLRGSFAGPEVVTALGPTPGLTLITPGQVPVTADRIYRWLMSGAQRSGTGLQTTEAEVFGSLALWLDLHSANMASLTIEGLPPPPGGWPCLFQFAGDRPTCFTFQMLTAGGMAVLDGQTRSAGDWSKHAAEQEPFELKVIGYGPQADRMHQAMLDLLVSWDKAGRPPGSRLRVRIYSPAASYELAPGEVLVPKRWTRMVVDWPTEPPVRV